MSELTQEMKTEIESMVKEQIESKSFGLLIRPKELANRLGMSEAFIWKLRREGDLPPAVQLGRGPKSAIGWREEDIIEWINSRIEETENE